MLPSFMFAVIHKRGLYAFCILWYNNVNENCCYYYKFKADRKETDMKQYILQGNASLGIELGSTRIKAVLIGEDHAPIASGDHTWENRLENGVWTYHMEDVWAGIQDAYANMVKDVEAKYGVKLTKLKALGISAMMHGYLPFDKDDNQI